MDEQREHAINVLSPAHEVSVAKDYHEAYSLLQKGTWDMVLTDLNMPEEKYGVNPTGFVVALKALANGVSKVAIVSNGQGDENRHKHPIFMAASGMNGSVILEHLWIFSGYSCPHMTEETLPGVAKPGYIKDWAAIVAIVTGQRTLAQVVHEMDFPGGKNRETTVWL
jgi:CheY-like chemotaxis protein